VPQRGHPNLGETGDISTLGWHRHGRRCPDGQTVWKDRRTDHRAGFFSQKVWSM